MEIIKKKVVYNGKIYLIDSYSRPFDNEINFVQFRLTSFVITTNANKKLYIKIKSHLKNVSLKFFQSFILNFLNQRRNRLFESTNQKNRKN